MTKKIIRKVVEKAPRQRSPNYPAVALSDAVERVAKIYKADGKAGSPLLMALRHMGYSSGHGQSMAVLSALKKYGLVNIEHGRVTPTQNAMDIIQFPLDHDRRLRAVQSAALSPDIIRQIVLKYIKQGQLPSDGSLRPELIIDWNFNPKAVNGFITDLIQTLIYAGLTGEDRIFLPSASRVLGVPEPEEDPDLASLKGSVGSTGTEDKKADLGTATNWNTGTTSTSQGRAEGISTAVAVGKAMRDLSIPLMDGETAFLRVPVPLTLENFEYLIEQIQVFKKGLVSKSKEPDNSPDPVPAPASEPSSGDIEMDTGRRITRRASSAN